MNVLGKSIRPTFEELQIDENAKKSDVVQLQVVEKLVSCLFFSLIDFFFIIQNVMVFSANLQADNDILGVYYDYLKQKDINASELLKSRHMEIDYLQSIVTKAENALSIDGIKNQVRMKILFFLFGLERKKDCFFLKRLNFADM
ncbi:hypothetical protein MIMGU_mgv1a015855mg [Erythranthe guttata]|uniref:Uncharacterized protein n=1 Tax=Erythranthe guttata TaxID=4155 RepID=A0A022RU77_ERYGU|nr:hypothetical protein MIMGU_mgv1a015855mg [Erythranthe guttata]